MIQYPHLKAGAVIGVTAPSSGVPAELHHLLTLSERSMNSKGFSVVFGDTAWGQEKARSSSAKTRADEFMSMMQNPDIDIIIPPWGGELLIEILEHIQFDSMKNKWVLGYSDVSALILPLP